MINRIFADIAGAAEKEAQQIVARATRVAEREREHARDDAAQTVAAAQAAATRDAAAQEDRAAARRAADTRRTELGQRDQFVNDVIARARARFAALPRDGNYLAWLRALLARGRREFGGAPIVVACNAQDMAVVRPLLAEAGVTLADASAAIAAGLILRSADGRVTLDCSADALLAQARDDLRDGILEQLHLTA
jgi:vacuolar-type H+-ATPase subunit E/Vma4